MIGVFVVPTQRDFINSPFKGRKPKTINFVSNFAPDPVPAPKVETVSAVAKKKSLIREMILTKRPINHLNKLATMFKPMLEASYMTPQEANEIGKKFNLIFDSELSNSNTYVYFDMQTLYPLITCRGSTTAIDWLISDPLILTGASRLIMPRVSTAQAIVKQVEKKYNAPADGFGHSMGSFVIENSGTHGFIFTYNKAVGFGDIGKVVKNPKQYDFRNENDIVSLFAITQDTQLNNVGDSSVGYIEAHGLSSLPAKVKP